MNMPSCTTGRVLWITGLSGAGKSTVATLVAARLRAKGEAVAFLDGDELREVFGATAVNARHHDRAARLALAMQYAHLCRVLSAQGLTVVIATISLFKEVHTWNRAHLPGYLEIYLKVPVDVLRQRDPKGIYRRYDQGQLRDVAGLDLAIDEPEAADLVIDYSPDNTAAALADQLMALLGRSNK